jgi:hypothetical protein
MGNRAGRRTQRKNKQNCANPLKHIAAPLSQLKRRIKHRRTMLDGRVRPGLPTTYFQKRLIAAGTILHRKEQPKLKLYSINQSINYEQKDRDKLLFDHLAFFV